jgi:hypothetical protein
VCSIDKKKYVNEKAPVRFWACIDVLLTEQKPVMCLKDKPTRNENVMKFNFELFVKKLTGDKFVARSVLSVAGTEFDSCAFFFCKLKGRCVLSSFLFYLSVIPK